ncbi:MAG: MATE family efflux transporter [Firmicutes bacterium]|nr:MATE family efflux transporter [Bacillota bacterium]
MTQSLNLLEEHTSRLFWHYLVPTMASTMSVSIFILFDTLFIGRALGNDGLAALNIALPVVNLLTATGLLLGVGGAAAYSVSLGQGKPRKAGEFFTVSMVLALVLGGALTLFGTVFVTPLARFLGAVDSNIHLVVDYVGTVLSASLFFVLFNSVAVFIRGANAPRLAMWGAITASFSNIILDALFIFGFGWGMKGAAIATALAPLFGLFVISTYFLRKDRELKLVKCIPSLSIALRVIGNGSSSFIMDISAGLVIFAFNLALVELIGSLGVSAYGIITNVSLLIAVMFTGVAQTVLPLVSINQGAGLTERVESFVQLGMSTAGILGAAVYLGIAIFPRQVVFVFTNEGAKLLDLAIPGLRLYGLAFLFMGLNIVATMYFQAVEKPRYSTIISLARGVVLILGSLTILPRFLHVKGVWLTAPLAELGALVISLGFLAATLPGMASLFAGERRIGDS